MAEDAPKRFTVGEANELLPTVVPLLESLRSAQQVMEQHQEEVLSSVPTNGGGAVHRAFQEAAAEAGHALRALGDLEIVVRDPTTGLIDFLSERDGQEVFLCWRLGEDDVAWWHPIDTGFAGRQPL